MKEKIVFYRGFYGVKTRRDRIMNWLWYWTAEREMLWAKLIYYPIHFIEMKIISIKRFNHKFHKYQEDCYWCNE